jgi:hypothetical protein
MTQETPKELLDKSLITEEQFHKIEPIVSGKIVSVFYELRTVLYLGVMLFTTGAGIIVYQNIGSIGHIVSIGLLTLVMIACYIYVFKKEVGYSHHQVKSPTAYYDYILLLGCLLFVSILGYLQFQYGFLDDNLGWSTLVTAVFFFYLAYRFDHVGVLSLAITSLASFMSISVSPQKWYSGEFFSGNELYNTAIIFSLVVGGIAFFLDTKDIKKHFTFTYLNFCLLIFFIGALVGMFRQYWPLYMILILAGCGAAFYLARTRKSFLFLLYAFVAGYIAITYLLAMTVFDRVPELWFYYSVISCVSVVYVIIRFKRIFKQS